MRQRAAGWIQTRASRSQLYGTWSPAELNPPKLECSITFDGSVHAQHVGANVTWNHAVSQLQ